MLLRTPENFWPSGEVEVNQSQIVKRDLQSSFGYNSFWPFDSHYLHESEGTRQISFIFTIFCDNFCDLIWSFIWS